MGSAQRNFVHGRWKSWATTLVGLCPIGLARLSELSSTQVCQRIPPSFLFPPQIIFHSLTASPQEDEKRKKKTPDRVVTHPKDGYTSNNRLILLRCQSLIYTLNPFRSGRGGRGHGAGRGWGALRWHGPLVRLDGVDVSYLLCRTRSSKKV